MEGDIEDMGDVNALPGVTQHDQSRQALDRRVGLDGRDPVATAMDIPAQQVGQVLLTLPELGRIDNPFERPELVFLAAEVGVRVDFERPRDLVAGRLDLVDLRPIGPAPHPSVDQVGCRRLLRDEVAPKRGA